MIRRRRTQREIPFSFDSFLDVVANVVGIILRLILVAWVGARSYHPAATSRRRRPSWRKRPARQRRNRPSPPDPLADQLDQQRARTGGRPANGSSIRSRAGGTGTERRGSGREGAGGRGGEGADPPDGAGTRPSARRRRTRPGRGRSRCRCRRSTAASSCVHAEIDALQKAAAAETRPALQDAGQPAVGRRRNCSSSATAAALRSSTWAPCWSR